MGILEEAQDLISGERNKEYGDVKTSFNRIAALWSAYLGISVSAEDVGKLMILLKISRSKYSNNRDSLVDIAGYVGCLDSLGTDTGCSYSGSTNTIYAWSRE